MSTYVVEGGKQLNGTIPVVSAKNSATALLCASVLVQGRVVFRDVPEIEEVKRMVELLKSIGVSIDQDGKQLTIDSSGPLDMAAMDKEACKKMRSSLMLFGALAGRESEFQVFQAGGCKLGNRSVRPHVLALRKLGIDIASENGVFVVRTKSLKADNIVMYESGDTATENVIMAAVKAPGTTIIRFASANYMVQDLCYFLEAAGAQIEGIGTTTLTITGVEALGDVDEYAIMPDPVDAMTWIALAATTGSPLTIEGAPLDFLQLELEKLSVMGQRVEITNVRDSASGHFEIADVQMIPSELKALPDKLYGRPYPGFNIDHLPLFVPILTQAAGTTLVHDWCYENRTVYYLEFQKIGGNVMMLDPHRALVSGKTELLANDVICPPAIRPGVALLVGMLAANGTSTLRNVYPIQRGYERLIERLRAIGAHISRHDDT